MSVVPRVPHHPSADDPPGDDTARADAWQRLDRKLRRLGARRAFLASLLLVGLERIVDELLTGDEPDIRADADGRPS
jgi:hypothetical protein